MAKKKRKQKKDKKKRQRQRRTQQQQRTRPRSPIPASVPDEQMVLKAFLTMETLADEPEFSDFKLDEHAADIIARTIADSDDEIQRLEKAGDEKAIDRLISEASLEALEKIVTPALKNDIRQRLKHLSRRLQQEGQMERAESIATLAYILDFPAFPWMLFTPLTEAFRNTVQQILSMVTIYHYIAEAVGHPVDDLSPEELMNLLNDPKVASYIEELYEEDETLREFLDSQFERAEDELIDLLFTNQIHLGLFTFEELALGIAWSDKTLEEAGITDDEIQYTQVVLEACFETLSHLYTPEQREQWRHRLEQAEKEARFSREAQVALKVVLPTLSDPEYADAPSHLLLCAYIGEINRLQEQLSTSDSPEAQAQLALIQQIKDRLKAGEPPW
ncbi:MAG: hypothetical protein H5T62_00890 [Anaerolineae bacterium]|nr:hypothetical protein [Anaerolineae bacterium]